MYLEDQNIRNIQQLASRIHIYVVVLLFSSLWNSLNCPCFLVYKQMKLNHVSCMSNSHCPALQAIFGWSYVIYVASCLSKLTANGRIRQEVGMPTFFHRSKIKTAAAGLMNYPMFTSWVDFSSLQSLGHP